MLKGVDEMPERGCLYAIPDPELDDRYRWCARERGHRTPHVLAGHEADRCVARRGPTRCVLVRGHEMRGPRCEFVGMHYRACRVAVLDEVLGPNSYLRCALPEKHGESGIRHIHDGGEVVRRCEKTEGALRCMLVEDHFATGPCEFAGEGHPQEAAAVIEHGTETEFLDMVAREVEKCHRYLDGCGAPRVSASPLEPGRPLTLLQRIGYATSGLRKLEPFAVGEAVRIEELREGDVIQHASGAAHVVTSVRPRRHDVPLVIAQRSIEVCNPTEWKLVRRSR